jgi:MFS family permease
MIVTSFLADVSSEMILTLLPLFLTNVLKAPATFIGLIEGMAETTASLLKIASGWLSDRLRQRKWLAVAGYALSAIAKPFLYIASSWAGVFMVRFTERVGKGIRTAPRDALIADSVDERQRGRAFGLHRAGDTSGAVVGLVLALLVVLIMQADALTLSQSTFYMLVIFSTIPAILAVIVLAVGAQDIPIRAAAQRVHLHFRALNPRFRSFLVIVLLFTLGNSADAFLILRAQERGLNIAGVLGMLIAFNLVYAVLSGPAGALSDRIGRRRLITFGWLAYALLYVGFALAQHNWQIAALYVLYGVYYASVEGTARALVADLVSPEQRGVAYGYYNAAVGLAALPASLLAGVLWQTIGPAAPFIAGAVLALSAVILLRLWDRGQQS